MPHLVALDIAGGPELIDCLRRVWDEGNAAAVIDRRLPPAGARKQLETLKPGYVMDLTGAVTRVSGGEDVEPGDALVVLTSGSAGPPKAAVLTHGAVRSSAEASNNALGVDPQTDRWLACIPLAHIGGLAVLTRSLISGTPVEVHPSFDSALVVGATRRGANLVSLVPTALRRIDAGLFRRVLLGGARPPEDLPPNVVTTYGMTETGSGVVYDGLPLQGVDLAVGDGDLGQVGEILVRGPMLMRAYRDGADPRLPGGWLATGDGGIIDASGLLHVDGRLAEVIVTGGEKVWPATVEAVLGAMPDVQEVAVVGRPDPEWGEQVVAVIATTPGITPSLAELREVVTAELARWAAPRGLVQVEALPRLQGGKIDRVSLRQLAIDRQPD